jgi:hypothetical protein
LSWIPIIVGDSHIDVERLFMAGLSPKMTGQVDTGDPVAGLGGQAIRAPVTRHHG